FNRGLPDHPTGVPGNYRSRTSTAPDQPNFSCIAPSGLSASRNGGETGDAARQNAGGIPCRSILSELNFDVYACSEIELHQSIDRLGVRLHNGEQPLVSTHLELLPRLLVDVRAAVHGELLDTRRQRNGPPNKCACAARGIRNFPGRLIEHAVIEGLEANADILSFHVQLPMRKSQGPPRKAVQKTRDRPARRLFGCGAAPRKSRSAETNLCRRGAYITS